MQRRCMHRERVRAYFPDAWEDSRCQAWRMLQEDEARMPDTHIGRSMTRLEDQRFLLGHGRYTDNLVPADALHMQVVRSPHSHAAIRHIDVSQALAIEGVHGAFVAADL